MAPTVRIADLLADYRAGSARPLGAERLVFTGADGLDVYNVSGVFAESSTPPTGPAGPARTTGPAPSPGLPDVEPAAARALIAGRVEARDSEHSSVVVFARSDDGTWAPLDSAASLELQDPFVFHHAGVRYLGGVQIAEAVVDGRPGLKWRTVVYDHRDPAAPTVAFEGPWGMKDLRFVDLGDGRLGVLTRPQGGADGRGRIGFTTVASLAALTVADIDAAPRLADLFVPAEWGGVNHAWLRPDGRLGLLGHIANFDDAGDRHYYPMTFTLDPESLEYTAPRILFERSDLPAGDAKRPDLTDVIFPGWIDAAAQPPVVYCGVGDAEAYRVELAGL